MSNGASNNSDRSPKEKKNLPLGNRFRTEAQRKNNFAENFERSNSMAKLNKTFPLTTVSKNMASSGMLKSEPEDERSPSVPLGKPATKAGPSKSQDSSEAWTIKIFLN